MARFLHADRAGGCVAGASSAGPDRDELALDTRDACRQAAKEAEMKRLASAITIAASLFLAGIAHATVIDFSTLPVGPITTVGDATFSLAGTGAAGDPYLSPGGDLRNTPNGSYPTNTILRVDFASAVSGVSFDFNPYGLNGRPGQGWSIYDSALTLIASGTFLSNLNSYDLSAYSDVLRIEWNNGDNNWTQGLFLLEYTAANAVAEPSAFAVMGLALAGLGFARRRRAARPDRSEAAAA